VLGSGISGRACSFRLFLVSVSFLFAGHLHFRPGRPLVRVGVVVCVESFHCPRVLIVRALISAWVEVRSMAAWYRSRLGGTEFALPINREGVMALTGLILASPGVSDTTAARKPPFKFHYRNVRDLL
jgi:hypothetical protein